ncbi:ABC transporter permease [Cryptosporangium aurantiacum]|uniref:Putative spermidine/putrescine transport system permease protein n=1 Tax=Cryptosporangium aurantiacum TaxID=134849 RepID=A0A1M7PUY3_9ACTN|nr:ABC transporter permease [Cryptosporangium aurantiacum]SHN21245.1 putative spermidine/putrescine transport system permease protein [Cryptosporangium aurantiacum]
MSDFRTAAPRTSAITVVLGVVVALFLLAPLAVILPVAFSADAFLVFPPQQWSGRWFTDVLTDPAWLDAISLSARIAAGAAVLATLAGTCAAFALRRVRRGQRTLRTLMLAPLVVPQLVLALGLYLAVDDLGGRAGLGTLLVGQAVLATPVVYLAVAAGLAGVDPALSRAARSLGHSWPSALVRVELPLVARSVAGSAVLAFGLCFDESVLAYYLSPPGEETLPTRIWLDASQSASPAIAAVSALVIGSAVVLLGVSVLLTTRKRKTP